MVHPYLRGAYAALPRQQLIFPGSSPHTWGILQSIERQRFALWFIPTYVGHTRAVNPVNIYCPVHPHIRGVYRWTSNKACPGDGSSPHTWGIQGARPARRRFLRFIPTYVGYTFVAAPVFTAAAVHPHIRGAYQFPRPVPVPHIGSSPHTWGIRCSTAPTIDISRFIPTYVGHTAFGPQNAPAGSVHPHTRGAYTGSSRNVNSKIGSSPHTWGIHGACSDFSCIDRFIPTYVGHTLLYRANN